MTSAEPFALVKIVGTLAGIAATPIKNKLERNETVIKYLKKFGFQPDHPPADFLGVYAYTLVEYGIGKPQPVLDLFRHNEIRSAFREAFEQNDHSILLNKGQDFIDGYAIGDQIKEIGIDPLPEFATFAMHFWDVTKKTRTPTEVLRDQKLNNLQRGVLDIQEQLARLRNSEEILLELAFEAENYYALQATNNTNASKIRKFILERQLRSWFRALKYEIEGYEVEEEDYFELIIGIPTRRGYDRILVRGVEGEAKLADVIALRGAVSNRQTNEGWLVAARRISPAACKAVDDKENRNIYCYTFDELLDQEANFNKYFEWLEDEVKRKGIDKMYVPLACKKDEFDPITKDKIGISEYNTNNGWIDGYIDRWLDDPSKEHISILGEFGTGKTWLTLHYAWRALQKYQEAKVRGIERPRIPLVIPLRDYAKAVSVESLFSEFFFRKYEIPLPGYSVFEELNRMGKLLLIFDGFDEMADRVDSQKMINNFWELARVVVPGSKAILTCRTEHFPEAQEGRALLNAELKASVSALSGEPPQFEVLELMKFDNNQIRQVLSFRTDISTVNEIMENPQLLDLASRPVMTELVLEALPEIEAGKPIDLSRVYLYAVKEKMNRDIKAERTFTSLADKLYFLCELSWEMLSTEQMSLNYRLFPDRLRRLFGEAVQEQKNLDHWHYDMMGQTMLIRNEDGDYMPAHRSLLEFFVAYKFTAELGILADDFLAIARNQSNLNQNDPQTYTWSSYFSRQCNNSGKFQPIAPLSIFAPEPIDTLADTFGKEPITLIKRKDDLFFLDNRTAILELIGNMISSDREKVVESCCSIILSTRDKSVDESSFVGGNVATILARYSPSALRDRDLSRVKLNHAELMNADLTGCDLSFSDLSHMAFDLDTKMMNTNFTGSDLSDLRHLFFHGWISRISASSSSVIHFVYGNGNDRDSLEEEGFLSNRDSFPADKNQIIVKCIEQTGNVKWSHSINTFFVLFYTIKDGLLHLFTVEGEYIKIEIESGRINLTLCESPFKTWENANLSEVIGLNERDIYLLNMLGAKNLSSNNYDPSEDKSINRHPSTFTRPFKFEIGKNDSESK